MLLMVALGAAIGAPGRYLTDRAVQARHETAYPWGTLVVNVVASLVLGVVTGAAGRLDPRIVVLIGTGFCGALSTFSTFSYETMRLTQEGARFHALANIGVSLLAGIGAGAVGLSIGMALI
jgi:CrcB protein